MAEPGGAVAGGAGERPSPVPAPAAHPGPHPNGRAPGRYYLLPYAGGGHAAYRLLTDHWAARPDRHPAAVPFAWDSARYLGGSGLRGLAGELARRIADDLAARPVDRYGLFGHSMGALLAYETAAALLELDCPPPAVLAVSGRVAPQYGFRPAVDLDDPRSTAEYLRSCGGALAQAAEDPEFVELVQERLRGDVLLGAEHVHQERPPLPLPVIALGGRDDPLAAHEEMAGWLRHGVGTGELRLFPGGHWFLWDHVPAVAARLAEALRTGAVTAEGGETTERPAECRNTFPGSNTA